MIFWQFRDLLNCPQRPEETNLPRFVLGEKSRFDRGSYPFGLGCGHAADIQFEDVFRSREISRVLRAIAPRAGLQGESEACYIIGAWALRRGDAESEFRIHPEDGTNQGLGQRLGPSYIFARD